MDSMVDLLTKQCEVKDYSLTPKALKRLRLYSMFALIGFPTFSVVELFGLLDGLNKPFHFLITLTLLMSAIPLFCDRIYNRLMRHRGVLDEREKAAVRKAVVFSYKLVVFSFIFAIVVGLSTAAVIGLEFRTPYINIAAVALVIMNIALIMLLLPITYIAWTEKPLFDEV